MTVITFPANINFTSFKPKLVRPSITMRSPFTGKRQALVMPYAVWSFEAPVSKQDTTIAGKIRSFLAQLDGVANTFRFPVPGTSTPLSAYGGAVGLVNGGSQTGSTLVTDGWANSTLVLREGDYFTVNDELKICTADATTNGSGQVTISFKPTLRTSPADNAPLTISNPTCLMAMDDPDAANWVVNAPTWHDFTFKCTEAF